MYRLILDILSLFNKREKVEVIILFFMILAGSILEGLGMGAVIPFIAVLSNPDAIHINKYLNYLYNLLSPESMNDFMKWVIFLMIGIYLIKNIYMVVLSNVSARFIYAKYASLSNRLFRSYLSKPYTYHLQSNSAQLLRNLENVMTIVQGIMFNLLVVLTELTVVAIIVSFLLAVDPVTTLSAALFLVALMFVFYKAIRKKLKKYGEVLQFSLGKIIQHINQGLGSIKETKILAKESYFADVYLEQIQNRVKTLHYKQVISQFPRFYIETATVSLIFLLTLFFINSGVGLADILITLTLLGLAAIRLMPSLSRIASAMAEVRTYIPAFNETYSDLKECGSVPLTGGFPPFVFKAKIEFHKVSYYYPESHELALSDVDATIHPKTTIGIVGRSGSGKTTFVDLLMGLLGPHSGYISVDGIDIQQNLRGWRDKIGYVPQRIYLFDDTVLKNVAFGLTESEIEVEKVWSALEMAQLKDFVKKLPDGLNTVLGENGVRCSGGQRQRIGIARALYKNPEVLIMDEATAALDNETERAFVEAISSLKGQRTIILIAHRLSTVKNCDEIFLMSKGRVIASGTYDTLIENISEFREIAGTT